MSASTNIYTYFQNAAENVPDRHALDVNNKEYTYRDLEMIVAGIANGIPPGGDSYIGLFAQKSLTAYAGILAILKSGKAYVPLNPRHPTSRIETIRLMAGIQIVIADDVHIRPLAQFLKSTSGGLTVLLPETTPSLDLIGVLNPYGRHRLIFKDGLRMTVEDGMEDSTDPVPLSRPNATAYVMFTSGSTGKPKGVPVSHENVRSFISYFNTLYDFGPEDRISQSFEIGFDPSVQDMFTAWSNGAALCCVSREYGFLPGAFIAKKRLTVWHSVPSIPRLMKMYGTLGDGCFPTLRYTMFGGEPLHEEVLYDWNKAAPNSKIDNLYGPTELTITISQYRWDPASLKLPKAHNGIVSIGRIYSTHDYEVIPDDHSDEQDSFVHDPAPGPRIGELLVTGPQMVKGYFNHSEATSEAFIQASPGDPYWYRTGDFVMEDEEGDLFYLERVDNQIKINGNRVELGEIAHTIERLTGPQSCLLVPYKDLSGSGGSKLLLFLLSTVKPSNDQVLHYCKQQLPDYMIPKSVIRVKEFPLNSNGKIDTRRLIELYEYT